MIAAASVGTRSGGSAWMAAAQDALVKVAESALGARIGGFDAVVLPSTSLAAYVPVMTPGEALHIGIVVDDHAALVLARCLLDAGDGGELSQDDVADAIGEIANIVAGAAKAAMSPTSGLIALGLPILLRGQLARSDQAECTQTTIADAVVTLVVILPSNHEETP